MAKGPESFERTHQHEALVTRVPTYIWAALIELTFNERIYILHDKGNFVSNFRSSESVDNILVAG